jgi:hypothetical protein
MCRQRFEREAKAVSSLNHPHICMLYDIGRQDGIDFIVMEYVEGVTLAARLEKGPLPTVEVLEYGIQLASARQSTPKRRDPSGHQARQHRPDEIWRQAARFRPGESCTATGRGSHADESPGGLTIQDVARDGRWLTNRVDYRDGRLSFDGGQVLARGPEGKYFIYPIAGREPRPVPGLTEADVLAQWSADGRSGLVYRRSEIPCRVEQVDLATGRRTLFKEFAPADHTGLLSLRH